MSFREINQMFSADTLLKYPDCTISFTVHNYANDQYLVDVIRQNSKVIYFSSRILIKTQQNYIIIDKDIILIVKCINQLYVILFGYEIYIFLDHKYLVSSSTQSKSQIVMHW